MRREGSFNVLESSPRLQRKSESKRGDSSNPVLNLKSQSKQLMSHHSQSQSQQHFPTMSQIAPSRSSLKNMTPAETSTKRRKQQPSNRQQQASVQLMNGLNVQVGKRNSAGNSALAQSRTVDKRNSASMIKLYQIEPLSLFERVSNLATPQALQQQPLSRQVPDYNVPKVFMSLGNSAFKEDQTQRNTNYNSRNEVLQRTTLEEGIDPYSTQAMMMAGYQNNDHMMAEEVMPDGVNRPNSLDVVNRHGGSTKGAYTNGPHSLSLYEQLRQSSGLNPFRSGASPLFKQDNDTSLRNAQNSVQLVINNYHLLQDESNHQDGPNSAPLERKITEILGKYLSPQKLKQQRQEHPSTEFTALKQISDTLNLKLDSFQAQLISISKPTSKLPLLYTTETQTDDSIVQLATDDFDELKIEIMRLQEKLTQEKLASLREQELMNEHLKHYQLQGSDLQKEIKRLQEALRIKQDVEMQERMKDENEGAAKDQLIKQLTVKLQDQTRKSKELKGQVRAIQESITQKDQEEALKLEEQAATFAHREREALERQREMFENLIEEAKAESQQLRRRHSEAKSQLEQLGLQRSQALQKEIDELKLVNQKCLMELQERHHAMERKDSDYIKTRDKLSNMEKDIMALKEQNKQLKLDNEDKAMMVDSIKRNESSSKGNLEQQIIKLKEQMSQEKQGKSQAEEDLNTLRQEFDQMKEFGRNKLQGLDTEKKELQLNVDQLNRQLEKDKFETIKLQGELTQAVQLSQQTSSEAQRLLNEKLNEKELRIRELEQQSEMMQLQVKTLQPKLDKKRQSISLIKVQQEHIQSEIRAKESQLELLNKQYEQEIRLKNQLIEDQNSRHTTLQQELKVSKSTILDLEQNLAAQRESLVKGNEAQLKQLQSQLSMDKQHLMNELTSLQEAKDSYSEKLKVQKEKASEMKKLHEKEFGELKDKQNSELEKLQAKLSEGVLELINKSREASSIQSQIQSLNDKFNRELEGKDHLFDQLTEKHNHVLSDLKEKQRQCDELNATLQILQNQSTDQESKQSQLLTQMKVSMQEMQSQLTLKDKENHNISESFQKQIHQLQQQSQDQSKQLNSALSQLNETLLQREVELKRTSDRLAQSESLSAKLTEQLQSMQNSGNEDKQNLSRQISKMIEEKSLIEKELLLKREEADGLSSLKSALNGKLEKKREKLKGLKGQLKSSESESQQLTRQISDVSRELQAKIGESLKETILKNQQIEKQKRDHEQIKKGQETEIADLQRLIQQIQVQKKEREETLEEEIRRVHERSIEDKQKHSQSISEVEVKVATTKKELRESVEALEAAKGETERLRMSQTEKGLAVDQQFEQIERLTKQVQALTKDVRDREDMISQVTQQSQQRHQEAIASLTLQMTTQQQQSHQQILDFQSKVQSLEQKSSLAQQKCDQLTQMSTSVNAALIERDQEVVKQRKDLQSRDKEIQEFFDKDYKQLQDQHTTLQDKVRTLETRNVKLQKDLEDTSSKEASADQLKPIMDELKKKNQLVMIKDSEVNALKAKIKELNETIEQNDSSKELQSMKKQQSFTNMEKQMKDVLIEQLKKELEKNVEQIVLAKEKEAQMASVINALTVQNSMIQATSKSQPAKPSPQQKKPTGKPNVSLI